MRSSKKKRPADVNVMAASIVKEATGPEEPTPEPTKESLPEKNPAAVALGRLGGLKGGPARAKKLSAAKRKEYAKKAADTRWEKSKQKSSPRQ
jgi:hypothetical protein